MNQTHENISILAVHDGTTCTYNGDTNLSWINMLNFEDTHLTTFQSEKNKKKKRENITDSSRRFMNLVNLP